MICPVCYKDMIVVEYKSIELDYCTECHGVWFDSGELGLLLKSLGLEQQKSPLGSFLDAHRADTREKRRHCPVCRQKMRKVTLSEQPVVVVDACQRGDGLWFDGGELAVLLSQLAPMPRAEVPAQQVTNFLREVFQESQSVPEK